MSSKFCKNQLYSLYILGFFITKLCTIFYYLHYFLLFSKVTYYFVWRHLPTNSNYFTKIYLLFSVTLVMTDDYKIEFSNSHIALQHTMLEHYLGNQPQDIWQRFVELISTISKFIWQCSETVHVGAWAPGDYENWEGTLIKLGGRNINLGGGTNGQN